MVNSVLLVYRRQDVRQASREAPGEADTKRGLVRDTTWIVSWRNGRTTEAAADRLHIYQFFKLFGILHLPFTVNRIFI